MTARRAAQLLAACAVALLTACAGTPAPRPAEAPAVPAVTPQLEVVAPGDLKTLIERHLDLARLGSLASGDTVDDSEWDRLIQAAPGQVRELLQTEGYFDPQTRVTSEGSGSARHVRLEVSPGRRTEIGDVVIEVQGALGEAESAGDTAAAATLADLRRAWGMPSGHVFRNADWRDAKAATLARLRAAGYANAQWSGTNAEIDPESGRAKLFLVADSGPLYRLGELHIEGLVEQDELSVRNLALLPAGAPVTEAALLDYQERLQKSGLFDSATVTLDPDPAQAATARVDVRLHEAPLQVWTFGLGVSANTGPRASVEHAYRRVFGGPYVARNKVQVGRLEQLWEGEVSTNPNEKLYRSLLGGKVDRQESTSDIVLSQQVRLGRAQDTQRTERLYFVQAERGSRVVKDTGNKVDAVALSVNAQGVWRQLDSVVLPTEGFSLSAQGGLGRAHGTDAETGPFARLYGRFTGYLPIGHSWYGQLRVELGQVVKKQTVAVPDSQLFRAGGDESVRGYAYRSLGPIVDGTVSGGTNLFTSSVELARPLSARLPSVWGAVFVDAGRAANDWQDLKPAIGYGFGVRWRSPVGPLRVDWAWGNETHKGRLHFSVGVAF